MSIFSRRIKNLPMSKVLSEMQADPTIKLIDVRTKDEFRGGRLPKAINVPVENLQLITKTVPNKDARIFVYCLSGGRSTQAAHMLDHMGYTDITNLGGIMSYSGTLER